MAKIMVEIDCMQKHCERCQCVIIDVDDNLICCSVFDSPLTSYPPKRLPECIAAEVKE